MARKVFVDVDVHYDKAGSILPTRITFEDGKHYEVTRVTQICRAASLKVGGSGIRYTCQIGRAQSYLFFDDYLGQWYVEAKA